MNTAQALFFGPIIGSCVGGLFGFLGSVVANRRVRKEMKPNGGGSVKDQVNFLTQQVSYLTTKLDDHIDFHLGRGGSHD